VLESYYAKRDEMTAVFTFGHATESGFHTIVPPQANPAQYAVDGALIEMMAS
jgi:hypothetical protein